MKKHGRALVGLLTGLCAILAGGCQGFKAGEAGSVGVIGGADGPTAIFVVTGGSAAGALVAIPLLLLAAGAVTIGVLWIRKHRRKK